MDLKKEFKKAMADNDIKDAKALSELTGVSYAKASRALRNDTTLRLVDVVAIASSLNLRIKFVKGDKDENNNM